MFFLQILNIFLLLCLCRSSAIFNRDLIQVTAVAMLVDMVTIVVHITGEEGITTVVKAEEATRGDDT